MKTQADEEQKRMEIELTKGSLRASGSQVDDLESVWSRRKLERTGGWTNSSANFERLPENYHVIPTRCRTFATQLQDSSILKKPEIPKSIRATEPLTFLPKTTFQQQRPSTFLNRRRSQSPKHNSRNGLTESQNQTRVSQSTPQKIYRPISGDPLE